MQFQIKNEQHYKTNKIYFETILLLYCFAEINYYSKYGYNSDLCCVGSFNLVVLILLCVGCWLNYCSIFSVQCLKKTQFLQGSKTIFDLYLAGIHLCGKKLITFYHYFMLSSTPWLEIRNKKKTLEK